ncbi:MAG: hypothetical protein PG978_000419 [Wolbachia endosymbiont of Ctenocephalides felis wCfeF]|nr:MAG: hypothetical protein PG978_000419 [Wolbachia endosymbiont of Ctenocephalides felis wCfeF]
MSYLDDKKGDTGITPITLSFQRVTLESKNFIRLVSIKVMLKCTIFMEN